MSKGIQAATVDIVTLVEQYSMIRNTFSRCLHTIHQLNWERGWCLSEEEQYNYATTLAELIADDYPEDQLRRAIGNYHDDHVLVDALRDRNHVCHDDAWLKLEQRVRQVLVSRQLHWISDGQHEFEDLIQVALLEIVRSLQNFRYACHFSTWAYKVIIDSVRRTMRDSKAIKRSIRPDSRDRSEELHHRAVQIPAPRSEQPTHMVDLWELQRLIMEILYTHKDKRLFSIFDLHYVHDRSIEEIGERLKLHPSRIRTLLKAAQQLVRESSEIQEWHCIVVETAFA